MSSIGADTIFSPFHFGPFPRRRMLVRS